MDGRGARTVSTRPGRMAESRGVPVRKVDILVEAVSICPSGRMANTNLPWQRSEYVALEPHDLDPTPAPTDAQRIRVAAALATVMRDANMTGQRSVLNAEVIRGVLVMDAEAWARDIAVAREFISHYDMVDPKQRFEQTKKAYG